MSFSVGEPIATEDFEELMDILGFSLNTSQSETIDVTRLAEQLNAKIASPPCVPTQRSMFA